MRDIKQERVVYKPFEYEEAHDYWLKQHQAHWLHTEVPMMSDINDWKQNLNETEKNIIGSILKGFAQTETVVNDYWTNLVTSWFRKPEIIKMGVTFGAFETIHAEAYSLLNETLGLDNFSEFLEDEATMAKIQNLMDVRDSHDGTPDWSARAKSLAIFSAFTEGVNLFSSFAILLSLN
jgi:ribonucleoside-diphosphate reductase beta chain